MLNAQASNNASPPTPGEAAAQTARRIRQRRWWVATAVSMAVAFVVGGLWANVSAVYAHSQPRALMSLIASDRSAGVSSGDRGTVEDAALSGADYQIAELQADPSEYRVYNGRWVRPAKQITMKVTAYSPDARSCGDWADGMTSSNKSVWTNGMRFVAADTRLLPFETILTVPGYNAGEPVPVLDRGGAIKGNRLDVIYPTHEHARQWGVQNLKVTVWEYVD